MIFFKSCGTELQILCLAPDGLQNFFLYRFTSVNNRKMNRPTQTHHPYYFEWDMN